MYLCIFPALRVLVRQTYFRMVRVVGQWGRLNVTASQGASHTLITSHPSTPSEPVICVARSSPSVVANSNFTPSYRFCRHLRAWTLRAAEDGFGGSADDAFFHRTVQRSLLPFAIDVPPEPFALQNGLHGS